MSSSQGSVRGRARFNSVQWIACGVVLALGTPAWAGSELDQLCAGDANSIPYASPSPGVSSSPIPLSTNDAQQKQQYCKAGKAAELAENADGKVWVIYAAAAAVCTTACVASMAGNEVWGGNTAGWVCTGSAIGAGVADAAWTKDYMSAVSAIGGAAAGYAIKSFTAGGAKAATDAGTAGATTSGTTGATATTGTAGTTVEKNFGACLTAAGAAFSAFTKHQDEGSSKSTVDSSVASLKALESNAATTDNGSVSSASATGGSTSGSTGTQSGSTGSSSTQSGSTTTAAASSNACSSDSANSSTASAVQCAAASSPNLAFASDPGFNSALQKATGMNLGQFMSHATQAGPAAAVASGLNGLGSGATGALGNALLAMSGRYGTSTDGAVYAGGGGGAGSGGSGAPDLANMMNGLMGQFAPKKDDAGKNANASEIAFGNASRALASKNPEEDRTVSLFARVATRYAQLTPRMSPPSVEALVRQQAASAPLPPLPSSVTKN